jgi:hypothetical protein
VHVPARARAGSGQTLKAWLAEAPAARLGERVAARWGADLPFLLKARLCTFACAASRLHLRRARARAAHVAPRAARHARGGCHRALCPTRHTTAARKRTF